MGLDLYHLKATLHPKDPAEAFTFREDDFDDHALDVLGFRRFIRVIPDWDYPTHIVIVRDEDALAAIRANGRGGTIDREGVVLLLGEPADLVERVERIEEANGWDSKQRDQLMMRFDWIETRSGINRGFYPVGRQPLTEWAWGLTDAVRKELERDPPVAGSLTQLLDISHRVPADFRGLYAEEVGYQRKGMSEGFYKEFGSPTHYVLRADVLRAARFLHYTWGTPEDDEELRVRFHEQFIAGFEEGTSILDVSW